MNPQAILAGLGSIGQMPLAKVAVRYWWLTVPLAYLAWHHYQARKESGKVKLGDLVADMAPGMSIALSLVMLDQCLAGAQVPGRPAPVAGLGSWPQQQQRRVAALGGPATVPVDADQLLTGTIQDATILQPKGPGHGLI
jgi:hypothetical protein